jgi:hypothetical protein
VTGSGFSHAATLDPSGAIVRARAATDPNAQWVPVGPGGMHVPWVANASDDGRRRWLWTRFRRVGGQLPQDYAEPPSGKSAGALVLHFWDYAAGVLKRVRYQVNTDGGVEKPSVMFVDPDNPGAGWQPEGWDFERDFAYAAGDLVKGFGTVMALILGATGVGAGVGAAVGLATGISAATMDALKKSQEEMLRRGILDATAPPAAPPPGPTIQVRRIRDRAAARAAAEAEARARLSARGFDVKAQQRAAAQASLAARGFQVRSATGPAGDAALVALWVSAGAALYLWHRSR